MGRLARYEDARSLLNRQLSVDMCLPPASFDLAFQHGSTLLSAVRLPLEQMDADRRRYRDHWELRLINYCGVAAVTAVHPRVLQAAETLLSGDNGNWVGDYSELRKLNDYLTPFALQVSGTSLFYTPGRSFWQDALPATAGEVQLPRIPGYSIRWLEAHELENYRDNENFTNALGFKELRPDVQVLAAFTDGQTVAIAGASEDSNLMRQIGVDVLPEHRGAGLASALVRALAEGIIAEGSLPFYGASPSHIVSQKVALKAGLQPTWWEFVSTSLNDISVD